MANKAAGFTLIEMLVGLTIGLIIVAAATVMMVTTLKSQHDITASARLNQEIGAAMAVMSNEIRRAGFSICDIDDTTFKCPEITDSEGVVKEVPFISYALADAIAINTGGDCIEYRYNTDVDADDDLVEHRGIRLKDNNRIQIAGSAGNVTCGNDVDWVDLTDKDVIKITALQFTTTGSNCRNLTKSNPDNIAEYWVVKDVEGVVQTGLACDNGASPTTPVDFCTVTEDPGDPSKTDTICISNLKVDSSTVGIGSGDELFGTHKITIKLNSELTRDQSVSKVLATSVKVANPWIGTAP